MRRAPWRWWRRAGIAAVVALSAAPVAALVPAALANAGVAATALSERRLALLARSVDLALAVAAVDVVIGTAAALWAWSASPRAARVVLGIAAAGLFVPPAAHAAAWAAVVGTTGAARGLLATVAAQATAFLPVALLVAWAGLACLSRDVVEAARVHGGDSRAIRRIAVGSAGPATLVGGALVALLALGDYAAPSTFGVDTFAMDVFAEHAANGSASALALSWPLLAIGLLAVAAIAGPVRSLAERTGGTGSAWHTPPRLGAATRSMMGAAALASAGAVAFVVIALAYGAEAPARAAVAIGNAMPDLLATVGIALAAGAVAGVVALAGGMPPRPGAGPSTLGVALAVGAVVVPPPVVGAGLITLWNQPATSALYDSALMPVLASCARFVPLAVLVVAAAAGRFDRTVLEASLVAGGPLRAASRVALPLLAPAALGAALLVLALAAGELGATIMVLPPGTSTAVVRAYNLLHFGAAADVAAIALAVTIGGAAAAVLAVRLLAQPFAATRSRA